MLRYLPYHQIDFNAWDACVEASGQSMVYAHSWYLSTVCKRWDAVVEELDGVYVSVFPLPLGRRMGQLGVLQPFFTQQLGLFTTSRSTCRELPPYLQLIPEKYKLVYLQLNTANSSLGPGNIGLFEMQERVTYHLDLRPGYEHIYKNYLPKHRPKTKKAPGLGLQVKPLPEIEPLIELFKSTKGKELHDVKKKHYLLLANLYKELQHRQRAELLQVADAAGTLYAAALLVHQPDKIILLFSSSSAEGRRAYAMQYLLDSCMRKYAGTNRTFDFEGSMIPSVAKFYANFGGSPVPYVSLAKQHLPWYLAWKHRTSTS
ncbi:GNAT family N-acetyltransferase [Pontibacter beigongshangensis]|uniref:GNAT family N-acetyltransferase n=1 Tax=Pontibacter beigongshangensis TaxID=2574733 RepID=UPI00164EDBCA|nr:GNAT family N-acetyltransferase [Pontibacter beigongshangensis]